MDRILLVSSSEKSVTFFLEIFAEIGVEVSSVDTVQAARNQFLARDYAICVINAGVPGKEEEAFAREAIDVGLTQVLFLVREADFPAFSARNDALGIFTLAKPLGKKTLLAALRFAGLSRNRLLRMREDNVQLRGKLQETRLVDRAKCILIQYLNMTEAQAHKYIEKQAMDMRLTKLNVAENILKTYES